MRESHTEAQGKVWVPIPGTPSLSILEMITDGANTGNTTSITLGGGCRVLEEM